MTRKSRPKSSLTPPETETISGDLELARYCGVSKKTVQDWRGKGLPCVQNADRTYTYDLAEVAEFRETLKSQHGSEGSELKQRQLLAEVRIKEAQARKREREEQEDLGNMLPLDEMLLALSEIVLEANQQILSVPKRFKAQLCLKCQEKISELRKLLEQTLQKLSESDVDSLRK